MLLSPAELRARFIAAATDKFAAQVPDFRKLRDLVHLRPGIFRNDHGAIRSADPAVTARIERAANLMGLRRELAYDFPAKKLKSFDLQVIGEDADQFKIFVSEVDVGAFPHPVAELIREDCAAQAAVADHAALDALIEKGAAQGGLTETDAADFLSQLLEGLMRRKGPPLRRATLDALARVSGEAASALALGPDFNHITIDVRAAGFHDIEEMAALMQAEGFRMLPAIQGARRSPLRQTATLAQTQATPVLEADGRIGSAPTEKQFVEIIERRQALNRFGDPLWRSDGRPLIYRNFLAANAEQIFAAAATPAKIP